MGHKGILLTILTLIVAGALIIGVKVLVIDRQTPTVGALRIDSFPQTIVFVNDKNVGTTPYFNDKIGPGEYRLKLQPASGNDSSYQSWQGQAKITSGALTYLSQDLASSDDFSGGQILTLEKLASPDSAELALVSTPDGAGISIDGLDSGKAPTVIHNITAGDHEIVISMDGYSDQVIRGQIIGGYRLDAVVKLAKLPFGQQPTASNSSQLPTSVLIGASPSGQVVAKPYVVIKTTPTGFLRVRTDPDLTATEAARVNPGEKYPLVGQESGWVEIKLANLSGWVSDQYVDVVK